MLAEVLSRVDILGLVDIFITLLESSKRIGESIDHGHKEAADVNDWMSLEAWDWQELLLVGESEA